MKIERCYIDLDNTLTDFSGTFIKLYGIDPFDYENPTDNTIMGYRVGYELSKGVSLIWDFRQFYRDDGTGKMKPIQQTNIETTFNF